MNRVCLRSCTVVLVVVKGGIVEKIVKTRIGKDIKNGVRKIAILRQSCDSFCVHKLQETTFVCNIAIDNFCLHYCS